MSGTRCEEGGGATCVDGISQRSLSDSTCAQVSCDRRDRVLRIVRIAASAPLWSLQMRLLRIVGDAWRRYACVAGDVTCYAPPIYTSCRCKVPTTPPSLCASASLWSPVRSRQWRRAARSGRRQLRRRESVHDRALLKRDEHRRRQASSSLSADMFSGALVAFIYNLDITIYSLHRWVNHFTDGLVQRTQ